ncbi:lipid-A-disaccharide synthase N-terminal domain-containing protein [Algoriphagus sanaruensis]|uniref:Polymyxin resistance protein ArnT n=1 Tax=Algoriphagus sanaruensis TaxID=1727163 RepID=A0A142EQQ5_9BACT|nr:lipid-A-disaccharide synthase N-terminal domain-containing protein [Algoriphagus sanaruensis]AMQ57460.1 polymyxin resistance protein ArnT [Algoriphagus sanaruensis]
MNENLLLGLGFLAQGMFSARFLIQLIKSEKSGKVENPVIFWQLSLFASFLLMVYGTFRNDLVIVGGQLLGYLVYIRNLQLQGAWSQFPKWLQGVFWLLPPTFFIYLFVFHGPDLMSMLRADQMSGFLLTWGTLGQAVFTSRFLIQWYSSERKKESFFPLSFWWISIFGALMIASYAIIRKDAVLFIGQAFGLVVYGRNLWLQTHRKQMQQFLLDRLGKYRLPILLSVMALVLYFNLGAWSVTESSEARYAEIGKEMLETGDWMHPRLMGIHHYHKPPVTYWITAMAYQWLGVSPFAARFFLQLAALLQVFLVYRIALLLIGDERKAFLSSMLYASMPILLIGTRALTTDVYLTTFVLSGLYFSLLYRKTSQGWAQVLSFLAYGFGFLTKGPVVWIVPVVVDLVDRIRNKRRFSFTWSWGVGLILMLGIGLSWFVFLWKEDAQFLDYFVFRHTIERFATDTFSRSQPFWYYWAILLVAAFPWFILLVKEWKNAWKLPASPLAIAWVWVLIPVLFFSLSSSKLILYILPVVAGLVIGAVLAWENLTEKQQRTWEKAQFGLHVLLLAAFLVAPLVEDRLVLNAKFWFIWVLTLTFLVTLFLSGIRGKDRPFLSAFAFSMGLLAMSTYFFSQNPGLTNDTRRVAEWINSNAKPGERIMIYDKRLPSIDFQTDLAIISIYDGDESLNRETQFESTEEWKSYLINLKQNPEWIQKSTNQSGIWLAKAKKNMPELDAGKQWELLVEIDGWKLMRIR